MTTKVLAFAGSLRAGSWNMKLVRRAAVGAREAGADVTELAIREYPLPVYDGDMEAAQGLPSSAVALKELFLAHDGLLIGAPEYNSSMTAALKNVIDWVSRPREGEASLACFRGKVAGLVAASPGGLGGIRGLDHVREVLSNLGVAVAPVMASVGSVHEAMGEDGTLADAALDQRVRSVGASVATMSAALGAASSG